MQINLYMEKRRLKREERTGFFSFPFPISEKSTCTKYAKSYRKQSGSCSEGTLFLKSGRTVVKAHTAEPPKALSPVLVQTSGY